MQLSPRIDTTLPLYPLSSFFKTEGTLGLADDEPLGLETESDPVRAVDEARPVLPPLVYIYIPTSIVRSWVLDKSGSKGKK